MVIIVTVLPVGHVTNSCWSWCGPDMEEEDYPSEIAEQLTGFETSVGSISTMLHTVTAMPRNDLLQKVLVLRYLVLVYLVLRYLLRVFPGSN